MEQKDGQDGSERLGHARGKGEQAGLPAVRCGAVKGNAAGQPFRDVMYACGNGQRHPRRRSANETRATVIPSRRLWMAMQMVVI